MEFFVQQKVLDIGVKIVFAVVEGIDNHINSNEWKTVRDEKIKKLLNEYKELDVHSDPILEGFNILHDNAGIKRRKNIPASENLIKLLKKNGDLFYINQAVDIYNIISLESKLALGAHNINKTDGNVTLRFTDGTERFQPIGAAEPTKSNPNEYSYCDDSNEILCRLEIRQVEKTKVDENTTDIFYIVQGNQATADSLLIDTARKIINTTTKYNGGTGRIITPKVIA